MSAHRPCVRCAAIRIVRLAFISLTFVPRGTAEWLARVDRVRWMPVIGDWRFCPSKPQTFRIGVCLLSYIPLGLLTREAGPAWFCGSRCAWSAQDKPGCGSQHHARIWDGTLGQVSDERKNSSHRRAILWRTFWEVVGGVLWGILQKLPLTSQKLPLCWNHQTQLRSQKPPFPETPEKGVPSQKVPLPCSAIYRNGDFFDSECPLLGWHGMVFLDSEPLFSRFWGFWHL